MALKLKYAIEASIFWPPADRIVPGGYKKPVKPEDIYRLIRSVEGCEGVELYYPYDFDDVKKIKSVVEGEGLAVSAVGIGFFSEAKWQQGGVTSFDRAIRQEAMNISRRAIEAAGRLGAGIVVFWPGQDGYDYYFQVDYQKKWQLMVDALRALGHIDKNITIGIEYKPKEPRTHMLVPNAAKALKLAEDTGCANVGVIMDIGHSLLAHENPAEEAVYLFNRKRLVHLHSNDNYNDWDFDLLPASVHFWENIEFLYWLKRMNYKGWMNFDICPFREDSVKACSLSIRHTRKMVDFVNSLDDKIMDGLIAEHDALGTQEYLWKKLFK